MSALALDHLKLVQSTEYQEIAADSLAAFSGIHELEVVHETDGSCCRVEPWETTCKSLLGAAAMRRGLHSLHVEVAKQ
jgi:hypothetical protein